MSIDPERVRAGLEAVRERIVAAGADPGRITVVAVTKGFGMDAVEAARAAGAAHLGENYAQELVAKAEALAPGPAPVWHFIGGLQTNKVRLLAPLVDLWESIDRPSLGAEVAKRAPGRVCWSRSTSRARRPRAVVRRRRPPRWWPGSATSASTWRA